MKSILHQMHIIMAIFMTAMLAGCEKNDFAEIMDKLPAYTYEVLHVWPHDPDAFTQGLLFIDGALFESTGLKGHSSLRRVELQTGTIVQRVDMAPQYFAEGLTVLNGKLFQLTWQNQTGFVYDLRNFRHELNFAYTGEGWGLATDGRWLIMSDGTDSIRFLNPETFEENRKITVTADGQSITRLNELEYINGEIFANVWGTDYVLRIDPTTGHVIGIIDLSGLLTDQEHNKKTSVLNGIAYDPLTDRLFITGKYWPKIFEVRLKLKQQDAWPGKTLFNFSFSR